MHYHLETKYQTHTINLVQKQKIRPVKKNHYLESSLFKMKPHIKNNFFYCLNVNVQIFSLSPSCFL
jgi:hypothetical protein